MPSIHDPARPASAPRAAREATAMNASPRHRGMARGILLAAGLAWAAQAALGQVQHRPGAPASSPRGGPAGHAGPPPQDDPGPPPDAPDDDDGADDPAPDPGIHPRPPAPHGGATPASWTVEGVASCGGTQAVDDPRGARRTAGADVSWHFIGTLQRDRDAEHGEFMALIGPATGEATTRQRLGVGAAGLSAGGEEVAQGRFQATLRLDLSLMAVPSLVPGSPRHLGDDGDRPYGPALLKLTEGQFESSGTAVHQDSGSGTRRAAARISVPNLVVGPPVTAELRVEGARSPYTAVMTDPRGCITVAGRQPLSVRLILQYHPATLERKTR
jgi:hypothetical protein